METFLFCRRDLPAGNLEKEISEKILKELQENGIHFITYQEPAAFRLDSNGEVTSLETNQTHFPADMVLVAVGVIPNAEIAKEAGAELGKTGAIRTVTAQRTNLTDIYTAGDCCEGFIHLLETSPINRAALLVKTPQGG
jgi:pyruvate/2-oxoglutarate dehydrogenase complex dihydrolipoamide dehydrogenase (E3) component